MNHSSLITIVFSLFLGMGSLAHGQQNCAPLPAVPDPGYPEGRATVDFDGDKCADLCRVVGDRGAYRLFCTSGNGPHAGTTFDTGPGIDPGYKNGRQWVDINNDGKADYCRVIGERGGTSLSCTLSEPDGSGFGETLTVGIDVGYGDKPRYFEDSGTPGILQYCRVVGSVGYTQISCTEMRVVAGQLVAGASRNTLDPNAEPVNARCFCNVGYSDIEVQGGACGREACRAICGQLHNTLSVKCEGGTKDCQAGCRTIP